MRVTVMGLGLFGGGEGAARHFASPAEEEGPGVQVTVTDLRDAETLRPAIDRLGDLPIRYVLGRHDEADFTGCDVLVVNQAVKPGNRYVELARASGARVTTELELALERLAERAPRILAVTGSNGKSTTTAMLASIMQAAGLPEAGPRGNVGGSLLAEADAVPAGAVLVLEVSSFQLERLARFPGLELAVITNLAPNHLDWHPTLEAYYAAKRRLVEMLPPSGRAVLNAADPALRQWGEGLGRAPAWFCAEGEPPGEGVWAERGEVRARFDDGRGGREETLAVLEGVATRGPHDVENALAAAAAARAFGAGPGAIAKGLRAHRPLEHRLQVVARARGLVFVDDSASTTPESAVRALESVDDPVVLIAGGHDKGLGFGELARAILERNIPVVLLGEAGERLSAEIMAMILNAEWRGEALGKPGRKTAIHQVADFDEAVRLAAVLAGGSGTVLLSPAAASLDEFRNYVERGERFADTARRLAVERAASDGARPPGR